MTHARIGASSPMTTTTTISMKIVATACQHRYAGGLPASTAAAAHEAGQVLRIVLLAPALAALPTRLGGRFVAVAHAHQHIGREQQKGGGAGEQETIEPVRAVVEREQLTTQIFTQHEYRAVVPDADEHTEQRIVLAQVVVGHDHRAARTHEEVVRNRAHGYYYYYYLE